MTEMRANITVDSTEIDLLIAAGFTKPIHSAVAALTTEVKVRAKYWLDQLIYKRSVPWKRTRELQKSIRSKTILEIGEVTVGASYGAFVEFGTRPHTIRPKHGKLLAFPIYNSAAARMKGKRIGPMRSPLHTANGSFKKSLTSFKTGAATNKSRNAVMMFAHIVRHPGTQAYPFMRNAANDVQNDTLGVLTRLVDKHLAKNNPAE